MDYLEPRLIRNKKELSSAASNTFHDHVLNMLFDSSYAARINKVVLLKRNPTNSEDVKLLRDNTGIMWRLVITKYGVYSNAKNEDAFGVVEGSDMFEFVLEARKDGSPESWILSMVRPLEI